jgi:hypothetical protein
MFRRLYIPKFWGYFCFCVLPFFFPFFSSCSVKPSVKSENHSPKKKKKEEMADYADYAASVAPVNGKRKGDDLPDEDRDLKRIRGAGLEEEDEQTVVLTLGLLTKLKDMIKSLTASEEDPVPFPKLDGVVLAGHDCNFSESQVPLRVITDNLRLGDIDFTIKDDTGLVLFQESCGGRFSGLLKPISQLKKFIHLVVENYKPGSGIATKVYVRAFEIAESIGKALALLQGISTTSALEKAQQIERVLGDCKKQIPRGAGKVVLIPRLKDVVHRLVDVGMREHMSGYYFSLDDQDLVLSRPDRTTFGTFQNCLNDAVDMSFCFGGVESAKSFTIWLRFFGSGVYYFTGSIANRFKRITRSSITWADGKVEILSL